MDYSKAFLFLKVPAEGVKLSFYRVMKKKLANTNIYCGTEVQDKQEKRKTGEDD